MTNYKSVRIVDGRPRKVIVNNTGKVINRNPTREEWKKNQDESNIRKKRMYCTDAELLECLTQFYEENGKIPSKRDFIYNQNYPDYTTYYNRFGSWNNALKLANMNADVVVIKGILQNEYHKGRLFEIYVRNHFKELSVDLSGDNANSYVDGICPKGMTYDAKSSSFSGYRWRFSFINKEKEEIEWYYLGAFNGDFKKLLYVWRIPGELIEKDYIHINLRNSHRGTYCVENMKEFEITDKFKDF